MRPASCIGAMLRHMRPRRPRMGRVRVDVWAACESTHGPRVGRSADVGAAQGQRAEGHGPLGPLHRDPTWIDGSQGYRRARNLGKDRLAGWRAHYRAEASCEGEPGGNMVGEEDRSLRRAASLATALVDDVAGGEKLGSHRAVAHVATGAAVRIWAGARAERHGRGVRGRGHGRRQRQAQAVGLRRQRANRTRTGLGGRRQVDDGATGDAKVEADLDRFLDRRGWGHFEPVDRRGLVQAVDVVGEDL